MGSSGGATHGAEISREALRTSACNVAHGGEESEADRTMSDGDNSTTGRHGQRGSSAPDGTSDTNQWLTRSARPSPGAAPWERGRAGDGEDATASSAPGNHTDGITVAVLI